MSEKIGRYVQGRWEEIPGSQGDKARIGHTSRRLLLETITEVLEESGRTKHLDDPEREPESGTLSYIVYAEPPLESPDEAIAVAAHIDARWQAARTELGSDALAHVDSFVPRVD